MKYLLLGGILVAVCAISRWSRDRVEYIPHWTPWRGEQAQQVTARILLGCVIKGSKRVVGSRRAEAERQAHHAVMAERELRAARMEWRQAQRKRTAS